MLTITSCNKEKIVDVKHNAPDYSGYSHQFMTFGYASPTNGTYYIDGSPISTGEDYQTVERYREYKEAGLNTMMLQLEDRYPLPGEVTFEGSHGKYLMDLCVEAGIENCIITDSRIQPLSTGNSQIIGPGCQFADQDELNEYVRECMADYIEHPAFYGLLLRDEPFWQHLEAFGQVYQAVKAAEHFYKEAGIYHKDQIYIEANLLPYTLGDEQKQRYTPDWQSMTSMEAYQDYLNRFLNSSHADKVLMDVYPFTMSGGSETMKSNYFEGVQILANFCKEHGLRFEGVAQSFGGKNNGIRRWSMPTISTVSWQLNHFMSMGMQTFAFFTYWRKVSNKTDGEWFNDGESFMTSDGQRTSVYYDVQTILNEMQTFAPVISNFSYCANKTIIVEPVVFPTNFAAEENMPFTKLKDKNITIQEGRMCSMSELYDKANKRYMYTVENIMDPRFIAYDDLTMEFSLKFGDEYNAVEVYYRGEKRLVPLKNGVYKSKLDAGYAEYLIPYKA